MGTGALCSHVLVLGLALVVACSPTQATSSAPGASSPVANGPAESVPGSPLARAVPSPSTTRTLTPVALSPTPAASPTETPIPDTLPGTVLSFGQAWHQGGLELTLTQADPIINFCGDRSWTGLFINYKLVNLRPQTVVFRVTQENLFATDNTGQSLPIQFDGCSGTSKNRFLERAFTLDKGKAQDNFGTRTTVLADITSPSITEIIVGATGISSITDAKWRIPINH
ncbi:MAG TPA: hypothetical protein VKU02_10940 [Gemmataceae bacterium]|nr:hypothetical protein [Gemmataceae bacterium]